MDICLQIDDTESYMVLVHFHLRSIRFTVQSMETKHEVQEQLNVCPDYPRNRNGLSNTQKTARDCSIDPTLCMDTSGKLLLSTNRVTEYRAWFGLVELVSLLELAQQGPDVHTVVPHCEDVREVWCQTSYQMHCHLSWTTRLNSDMSGICYCN